MTEWVSDSRTKEIGKERRVGKLDRTGGIKGKGKRWKQTDRKIPNPHIMILSPLKKVPLIGTDDLYNIWKDESRYMNSNSSTSLHSNDSNTKIYNLKSYDFKHVNRVDRRHHKRISSQSQYLTLSQRHHQETRPHSAFNIAAKQFTRPGVDMPRITTRFSKLVHPSPQANNG